MIDSLDVAMDVFALMQKTAGVAGLPKEQLHAAARALAQAVVEHVAPDVDTVVGWSWGPTWHGTLTVHVAHVPRGGGLPEEFVGLPGGYARFTWNPDAAEVERVARP